MIIARCSVRDRCNQNDREHFVGNIIATIHVCRHGSPNVQGRGHFLRKTLKTTAKYNYLIFPNKKSRVTTQSGVKHDKRCIKYQISHRILLTNLKFL